MVCRDLQVLAACRCSFSVTLRARVGGTLSSCAGDWWEWPWYGRVFKHCAFYIEHNGLTWERWYRKPLSCLYTWGQFAWGQGWILVGRFCFLGASKGGGWAVEGTVDVNEVMACKKCAFELPWTHLKCQRSRGRHDWTYTCKWYCKPLTLWNDMRNISNNRQIENIYLPSLVTTW